MQFMKIERMRILWQAWNVKIESLDLRTGTSKCTRSKLKVFARVLNKQTLRKASFYFFFYQKVSTVIYTEGA